MKLIVFNLPDKPENLGPSHKVEDVLSWANERSGYLPNPAIEDGKLTFDVPMPEGEEYQARGYAIITDIPEDFQN